MTTDEPAGHYLVDHPPKRDQFRRPRRAMPSGVIVLHSAENLPDVKPPDTGAEDVARFIRDRSDAGSYHRICDSDSTVKLVPFWCEAYHDGTGTNRHSIGISGAFQADQWPRLPVAWRDGCLTQMAHAAAEAALWVRERHGIEIPARRITAAQARGRVPGFVTHGMLDPSRRSDPDATHTGDRFPWDQFFTIYRAALGQADTPEEDDMGPAAFVVVSYYAILGRRPESLATIGKWVDLIERSNDGGNSFIDAIANSDEAKAREKKLAAGGVDRVRSDQEILDVVRKALG